MKQKNVALKIEVKACHNKEWSMIWAMLLSVVIVAAGYVVGAVKRTAVLIGWDSWEFFGVKFDFDNALIWVGCFWGDDLGWML